MIQYDICDIMMMCVCVSCSMSSIDTSPSKQSKQALVESVPHDG